MKFRLAALSIISIENNTTTALRRVNAPSKPMQNNTAPRMRQCSSVTGILLLFFATLRSGHRADERGGEQQRQHFERDDVWIH